jgi:hypothetical protein
MLQKQIVQSLVKKEDIKKVAIKVGDIGPISSTAFKAKYVFSWVSAVPKITKNEQL